MLILGVFRKKNTEAKPSLLFYNYLYFNRNSSPLSPFASVFMEDINGVAGGGLRLFCISTGLTTDSGLRGCFVTFTLVLMFGDETMELRG